LEVNWVFAVIVGEVAYALCANNSRAVLANRYGVVAYAHRKLRELGFEESKHFLLVKQTD
jgi:hypothetical protein